MVLRSIAGARGLGRPVALALSASLALSACATTQRGDGGMGGGAAAGTSTASTPADCSPNNPNLTAAERQMCKDADIFNETVAGGAMTGALIGGLIGALAGLASGGNGRSAAQGALIGAVAGGVMGGVDGYVTAKAQEQSNNRVRMVNSMAADIEADNAKLEKLVESSRRVLEDSKQRIEKVNADYNAGRASLAQVQAENRRLAANRDRLEGWLKEARARRDNYVAAANQMRRGGASTQQMDAEIAQMNAEVAQLEQTLQGMNSAMSIQRT